MEEKKNLRKLYTFLFFFFSGHSKQLFSVKDIALEFALIYVFQFSNMEIHNQRCWSKLTSMLVCLNLLNLSKWLIAATIAISTCLRPFSAHCTL